MQERPDALLQSTDGSYVGVELTHLYHDPEEARLLLRRSDKPSSGLQAYETILTVLNERLADKAGKIPGYGCPYPVWLLIASNNPIWGLNEFERSLQNGQLQLPAGLSPIWLLVRTAEPNQLMRLA